MLVIQEVVHVAIRLCCLEKSAREGGRKEGRVENEGKSKDSHKWLEGLRVLSDLLRVQKVISFVTY